MQQRVNFERLLDSQTLKSYTNVLMSHLSSFRIVRVTLAFAVALWMAGAGCLLGCENTSAVASTRSEQPAKSAALVVSGDTCSKHGARANHHTNAKKEPNAKPVFNSLGVESTNNSKTTKRLGVAETLTFALQTVPSTMMDCPLAVNATAALSKAGADHSNPGLALTDVSQPPLDSLEQLTALVSPPRLPNRGHTYLRCCVFLI